MWLRCYSDLCQAEELATALVVRMIMMLVLVRMVKMMKMIMMLLVMVKEKDIVNDITWSRFFGKTGGWKRLGNPWTCLYSSLSEKKLTSALLV